MIIGAFLALFTALFSVTFAINTISTGVKASTLFKVVIDAGHGGVDGGVSGIKTGVKESELNLAVAKELFVAVKEMKFQSVLTRSSSAGLYGTATANKKKKDMEKRKNIILKERPDAVVSIHMNYYDNSSRRGAQVFYKQNDANSKLLADLIQDALNNMPSNEREYSALKGDYYILNCTNYPSVLIECGFLSNPEDERLLSSTEYQSLIAKTVANALSRYALTRA